MKKNEARMADIEQMSLSEIKSELKSYREKQPAKRPIGKRAVFVIDRGWIFAGDATKCSDGYIRLDNAVWLFSWKNVGFSSVILDPKQVNVDIRKSEPVEIPLNSIIFRIPVVSNWGL